MNQTIQIAYRYALKHKWNIKEVTHLDNIYRVVFVSSLRFPPALRTVLYLRPRSGDE